VRRAENVDGEGCECLRIPKVDELPGDSDTFPRLDECVALMKGYWVEYPVQRPGFESIAIRLGEMVTSLSTGLSQLDYVPQRVMK
jgi:hypothetical protein